MYRTSFEERAKVLGGKGAWDETQEALAKKIGFNVIPNSVRMTIQEVWAEFIEANIELVEEGNGLINRDIKTTGEVSEVTIQALRRLIERFVFPEELASLVRSRTKGIKGKIIDCSSFINEDSYERNLAGIFISPRKRDEWLFVQAEKEMFKQAMTIMWIRQNSSEEPIEGVPNILSAEQGLGSVAKVFLDFDASGIAKSNLYGYTSIGAVIGDAETLARPVYANSAEFLFKKGSKDFEYNTSFLDKPYEFRLKGKWYRRDTDSQEMDRIIKEYPKIDGAFSPISREEAIELNRVINALEDEIGVPLDVEWGFLDGELYIIHYRPIIGDFRKPLVEISPALQEKTAIAETPVALGHTSQEGFTGRMVLFGSGVTKEIVEQFEEEYRDSYIRLQSDVASKVLGGVTTRAKVLVDIEQGSREAHNINLITHRINRGEFAYCNGPVLRDGLEENITFIPHPTLKGVWVSTRDVTYFSDGLRGSFYLGDEEEAPLYEITEDRQRTLVDFHERVKDIWDKSYHHFNLHGQSILFDIIIDTILGGKTPKISGLLWSLTYGYSGDVRDGLLAEYYSKEDLYDIQPKIALLEEALSYPLYPHHWENIWMKSFSNLLELKGINEDLEKEDRKEISRDEFRVIMYDFHRNQYEEIESILNGKDQCIVKRFSEWNKFGASLRDNGYDFDFVLIHFGGGYMVGEMPKIVWTIRKRNPDALIVINSGRGPEMQLRELQLDGYITFLPQVGFSTKRVIKMAERQYDEWQERQQKLQAQKQKPERPKKPESLTVLWIQDDSKERRNVKERLSDIFGSDKGYKFIFASSMEESAETMESTKFDVAVFDLNIHIDRDYMVQFRDGLTAIPNLYAVTLGEEHVSLMQLSAMFGDEYERVEYIAKSRDIDMDRSPEGMDKRLRYVDKLASHFKRHRQEQEREYEDALANWQAAYGQQEKPGYPEKLRALMVDDFEPFLWTHWSAWYRTLSGDEYGLECVASVDEAIEQLAESNFDLIIYDFRLPNFNKRFEEMILQTEFAILLTGWGTATDLAEEMDKQLWEHSSYLDKTDIDYADILFSLVKDFRRKQIENYEQALREWEAIRREARPEEVEIAKAQTIFIINTSSQEGNDLAEFVGENLEGQYNIVPIDSMWKLERELAQNVPDLVITDTHIDGKEEIAKILQSIAEKNRDVKFIITSEESAILPRDSFKGFDVLGVIEKPFYFRSVLRTIKEKSPLDALLERTEKRSIDSGA